MRRRLKYLPYEELQAKINEDQQTVSLQTPWLSFDAASQLKDSNDNIEIAQAINDQNLLVSASGEKVSWFLEQLHAYPLSYRVARQGLKPSSESWMQGDHAADHPAELLRHILDFAVESRLFPKNISKKFTFDFIKTPAHFRWQKNSAQLFAYDSWSTLYDPLSLFTVIRRFHLKDMIARDRSFALYQKIEHAPTEQAFALIKRTLIQNYFITKHCRKALAPALNLSSQAKKQVEGFILSEEGHDHLLQEALKSMGADVTAYEEEVTPSAAILMALLFYAASHHFAAFCCALDMFERDDFQSEDTLARLVSHLGYPKAARFLQKHKDINQGAEHHQVGERFLSECGLEVGLDARGVLLCLRISELLSYFINSVSRDILLFAL